MPFLRNTNYNVLGYSTFSKCNILGYSKLDLQRLYSQSGFQNMSGNEQQLITTELFPTGFIDFKTMIFDHVIIPLLKNEDKFLIDNLYMITIIKNRLNDLIKSFPNEDFTFYQHIVDLIFIAFEKTELLDKYNALLNPGNGVVTMNLLVKRVFLKTEFEIYNIVFGRPNVSQGETYDNNRIDLIYKLLHNDNLIRIEDFKERLLEK